MDLITYETIRAAQRAEKEEQLQQLPKNFFQAVKTWIIHKQNQKDTSSLLETENAKKLLEDIINRREKKIVLSALRTMRGELPPDNLTEDEQRFFDQIVNLLKTHRETVYEQLMDYTKIMEEKIDNAKKTLNEIKEIREVEKIDSPSFKPNGKVVLKILSDVPRFVGSNEEAYGPLKAGDIITLDNDVANILISRKVAENLLE